MNCGEVRDNLYEYLEGSLATSKKGAVEEHLAVCLDCREAVRTEAQFAQSFSNRLEQAVQALDFDALAQRRMAKALEQKIGKARKPAQFSLWSRLVFPVGIAGLILTTVLLLGYSLLNLGKIPSRVEFDTTQHETAEATIHLSYPVPSYTFQKKGNLVIDALTSKTLVAEGWLTSE